MKSYIICSTTTEVEHYIKTVSPTRKPKVLIEDNSEKIQLAADEICEYLNEELNYDEAFTEGLKRALDALKKYGVIKDFDAVNGAQL